MKTNNEICGIAIAPVLELIRHQRAMWQQTHDHKGGWYWCTWADIGGNANCVLNAMPDGTTERRARAFMKVLDLKYGLISGCHCGCRGDYELTDKGLAFLKGLSE